MRPWYDLEKDKLTQRGEDPSQACGNMFETLWSLKFGDSRVTEGPLWDDMPKWVLDGLSQGHQDCIEDLITKGHRCAGLGPREGYAGDDRETALGVKRQIVAGFIDTALAWKPITFPRDLEGPLREGGGRFAPLGAVYKYDDNKELRMDEEVVPAVPKMRAVHDETDGGHPNAHNTRCKSYRVAK